MNFPLPSALPPELRPLFSSKVKKVIAVAIVVALVAIGFFTYYWVTRTVSVTFVESGLPAGSNWSVTMWTEKTSPLSGSAVLTVRTINSTADNPSSITVTGLAPTTQYVTSFNYPGAYAAFVELRGLHNKTELLEYNKPLSFWQNPSQPMDIETNSSSSTVRMAFYPFVNVVDSSAFVYFNNQTYGMSLSHVGPFSGAWFGPQPPNDTTVGYDYIFAPGTVLGASNGTLLNLTGSFNVTAVSLQSNVSGLSIIDLNRTLPWHVYMSPTEPEILEINVYVPHKPIIQAMLNFTLTIEDWNPNG